MSNAIDFATDLIESVKCEPSQPRNIDGLEWIANFTYQQSLNQQSGHWQLGFQPKQPWSYCPQTSPRASLLRLKLCCKCHRTSKGRSVFSDIDLMTLGSCRCKECDSVTAKRIRYWIPITIMVSISHCDVTSQIEYQCSWECGGGLVNECTDAEAGLMKSPNWSEAKIRPILPKVSVMSLRERKFQALLVTIVRLKDSWVRKKE